MDTEPLPRERAPASAPLGVVALVLLLLGGFVLIPRLFAAPRHALEGTAAPAFDARVVLNQRAVPGEGARVTSAALAGRPMILDFWASWCGPCQVETPMVNRVAARFRDRGLVVVGVDTSEEREDDGKQWAITHGVTFPIVYDDGHVVASAFGVKNLPTLVVVSKSGTIVAVRSGITDDAELERLVQQIL